MDGISENISDFESLLKNRSSKKPPALYTSSEERNKLLIISKTSKISAKEVLANVSRQVKAMQNADTASCKRVGNNLDKYKKSEFMTVDMLPVDRVVHRKQPTKFETQCVSDTQLINVIENAEIADKHGGVTQEFDKTFFQNSDSDSDDKINDNSLKPSTKADIGTDSASEIINSDMNSISKKNDDNKLFDNSNVITCDMDTITCYKSDVITDFNDYTNSQEIQGCNKSVEIFNVSEDDADRPLSPVLNTNRKNTASPLVVDLYAFEKFENLANPIIEEHGDMRIAKNMINSQIIGKEILISDHNYDNIGRDSPVLSKIDCITTNFNEDDVKSICTCSNNCINRDVKCTNKHATEDIILTSENKKTQSKIMKAEIKDEILFSSDEEYEYLHKSIQELPLTCALETSFYDTSDVLDKTMYVGFQTASNKSIQINTDSFTKAKSILSDVDYEEKGKTLIDLVEIFDSGKAVDESVENVKLTRDELDYRRTGGTDIQASSEIEHSDKNLSQPSNKLMFEEKIYDTLENVSLTALEQIKEANDEIRMSQIINFKSTLRSADLNNSSISDRKVNDTLDNLGLTVLEQYKEKDDDIMMSQVLTFKSISRTPHVAASVCHDSTLRKVLAKRKLEGFKTASNKKIKLSDNALARCKKVFQDIDLDESEYLSSKSNFIDTEEITHEDFKTHDFDISYDASKASSEVNHTKKENYICDNVSNKMISGEDYFETEVKEQPRNEDIDLQINDQTILQEFEENEMPLKETNNNACVGFKTASNKNIAISEVAMAATKHVFQDIMTIAATTDSTIKVTDDWIDGNSKYDSVLKTTATDVINMVDKTIKPSVDALRNNKSNMVDVAVQRKQADDHESYDFQKPLTGEFVGFKTASHKEIIISAQAREKVKDFYRDLDKEHTQNVNKEGAMNSNTVKKLINNVADEFNCGIDTQDFLAEELTHIEELFKDNTVENKNPASPTFQGFQTASKKAIVISETALGKSKKLFEDITNKETKDIEQDHDPDNKIKTQPSKDTNNLESFDSESQSKVFLTDFSNETSQLTNMTNKTPDFAGCQTFSNINVCVSKKGIKAAKTLLQDNVLFDQRNIEVEDSETSLEHNNVIFHDTKMSGTIQNEFLKETHAMLEFQNVNNSAADTKIMNTEPPMFAGFKTASAKPICISAAAMEKTKRLFSEFEVKDDDLFDNDYGSTSDLKLSPSRFLGFQTANKKKINISAKSKQLLSVLELKDKNNDNDDYDKKIFKNLDKNLKDDSVSFNESNTTNEPCKPSTSKFIGFQTASNKAVNISKEALARSKQLFQDVDIFIKECDTLNEKITIREENKNLFHDVGNCNLSGNAQIFPGFQTASNKTVKITVKALQKSKKLFEDFNLSQLNKEPNTTVDSNGIHGSKATANDIINDIKYTNHENRFQGFQTASNKTVKVSEQAMENTKDVIKDFHVEKGNGDNTLVFKGFQTASNKQVQASEKAIAVNKKLFEDNNLSQFNIDPSTIVQTQISNDIKDPIASIHGNKFTGFQTASNKKVIVSDQALAKTKDVFKDIHIEKEDAILTNGAPIFKGFQTASNKKVAISEKALAKSKKLFEDINLSQIEQEPTKKANLDTLQFTKADDVANKIREPVSVQFSGFQTASDREVKRSEQALAKTKDIFKDIHAAKENVILLKHGEIKTPDLKANVAVINSKNNNFSPIASKLDINRDIIDTQILNDCESTLNTEDFSKSTLVSKRSGSPILSCPRAKKRKFETPYRTSKKVEPRNVFVPPKLAKTYNFNEYYKKHKKYTLKDIVKLEKEQPKVDVDPHLSEFDIDSLQNFVFNGKRNDYTEGKMSIGDLKKIFLDSVNKRIVPEGWLDNHIKLIIWKLLSYEFKFRNVMKNTCTVKNVLEQLKYRYDKELYHVQRPILRKILEKDEVPSKTMVLCVAAIYLDNVSVTSVPPSSQNVDLLVTDGWYSIKACLDRMLIGLVVNGSIVVGTKIAVCGAELINCEQGVAPWEDTSSVRLKLHGNSTRRARWFARLGPRTDLIQCGLRAARADGGRAAVVRLALTRVYPPMTVERMDDGSTVTLSERLENIRQMKYESERQVIMEKLYEEVEKEMSDQDSQDSEGCSNDKGCIDSGSQIAKGMKRSKDPDEYRSHLTTSQSRMLEDHNSKQRDKLVERVRERFQEKLDKYGLKTDRNVVQLLKVRVADFTEKAGSVEVTKGYLSVWRPSAAVLELVTEGAWIEISNVIPTGIRNSEIQLSTGRQTVFNPYKQKNEKYKLYANTLKRKCYEIKEITFNPSMTTDYNEIDTVGMIFCIEPSTKEFHEQSFQNVYLADADKNIICVNFWGGLKKFGYENVLDTGQIITCVNLQKRAGNTRKSIPQYRVTELSYFTKTPKSKTAMEITNEMTNKLSKIKDKFCEDCIFLKNNYSILKTRNNENVSPYRFEYIPKNIISPRNCDVNLNLTGLDFESSFDTQEISPQALLRKKKVNEKIEKIRLNYGEPPPLSSIHIINKSKNASATYKSPLISNLELSKSPLKMASPVTVNRALVKNVNPVKLNFSSVLNESADHFAEDFDASPPLSLDSDTVYK